MSSFSSIEAAYYTPRENHHWDAFVDWCEENGFNYDEEDFDVWVEERMEAAESEAAERAADYAREEGY